MDAILPFNLEGVPDNLRGTFKVLFDTTQMLLNEQILSREREIQREADLQSARNAIAQLQHTVTALSTLQHSIYYPDSYDYGVNLTYFCIPTGLEEYTGVMCVPLTWDDLPENWKQPLLAMPTNELRRMKPSSFFGEFYKFNSPFAYFYKGVDNLMWVVVRFTEIEQPPTDVIGEFFDSWELEPADPRPHAVIFASAQIYNISPFQHSFMFEPARDIEDFLRERRVWLQELVPAFDGLPDALRTLLVAVASDDDCLKVDLAI